MIWKVSLSKYSACLEAVRMEGVAEEAYCTCRSSVMGKTTMEMAVAAFVCSLVRTGKKLVYITPHCANEVLNCRGASRIRTDQHLSRN